MSVLLCLDGPEVAVSVDIVDATIEHVSLTQTPAVVGVLVDIVLEIPSNVLGLKRIIPDRSVFRYLDRHV